MSIWAGIILLWGKRKCIFRNCVQSLINSVLKNCLAKKWQAVLLSGHFKILIQDYQIVPCFQCP